MPLKVQIFLLLYMLTLLWLLSLVYSISPSSTLNLLLQVPGVAGLVDGGGSLIWGSLPGSGECVCSDTKKKETKGKETVACLAFLVIFIVDITGLGLVLVNAYACLSVGGWLW